MKKFLIASLALLLSALPALAQAPQIGSGEVFGNSTAAQRNGRSETVTAIMDRAFGSTRGSILRRGASGWAIVAPGTSGLPWISNGAGADPAYQALLPAALGSQTANFVLAAPNGSAGNPTFRLLVGADLPNPAASSKGGVQSLSCSASNWFNSLSTSGVLGCAQPSFAALTGSLTCAQAPALTGDITTTAGSCATTLATVNANVGTFGNSTTVPTITLDAKGRATGASATAIPIASSATSGLARCDNSTITCPSGVFSAAGGGSGVVGPQQPQIRLTLTQGTPITSADVNASTAVYLEPYNGNQISLYSGTWASYSVTASTYQLPATQTQTCTLNATVNVTGCTDTSQLTVGEQVTGTGITGTGTIATIVSTTAYTLSAAASGSGAQSLTFKLPPSTNYDVYALVSGSVPKLVWSAAWTSDTAPPARGLQDGVEVASGSPTLRLVGSARTTTVAGQIADGHTQRWLSNRYNEQPRPMWAADPAGTWSGIVSATFSWRQANGNASNQIDYITCVPRPIWAQSQAAVVSSAGAGVSVGIGIDTTLSSTAQFSQQVSIPSTITSNSYQTSATYTGTPGLGRHIAAWIESSWTSGTQTWIGTSSPNTQVSGIYGEIAN